MPVRPLESYIQVQFAKGTDIMSGCLILLAHTLQLDIDYLQKLSSSMRRSFPISSGIVPCIEFSSVSNAQYVVRLL